MVSDNYYTVEPARGCITPIRSKTAEIMYLIQGSDRAVLVDTCLGVGNIRKVVESATDKPITVLLTHGHMDHAMGAPLFDDVYMNSKDNAVFVAHSPIEKREGYVEGNLHATPGSWTDAEWVPPVEPHFKELHDGDVFDLGGVHVETYSLAGHTPGIMVMLVPEAHVLITGDAANTATFLFDEFSSTVEEYQRNLAAVIERLRGRYDRCYMMHHDMEASGRLLENVRDVCEDILAGKADDQPFNFHGGRYYIAKNVAPGFRRLDGGEGNIIYNKQKVFGVSGGDAR